MSRCLCACAQLGVPEALRDGPRTATAIGRSVGADVAALRRLLEGLTVFGVFERPAPDVFALTPLGRTLCQDAPASALPTALLLADEVGAAWSEVARTVRTGDPAFVMAHEADLFDYLEAKPERREIFDRSQAEGLALERDEILAHLDLRGRRRSSTSAGATARSSATS